MTQDQSTKLQCAAGSGGDVSLTGGPGTGGETEAATTTYPVECGYMVRAPIWETHKRGRNWAAVITRDPTGPGGLARTFLPRGRGEFLYSVESVSVRDALEFGADYLSGSGNRTRSRVYTVVVDLRADGIDLVAYPTAVQAIKAGMTMVHQDLVRHAPRRGRRVRALEEVQE